MSDPKEYPKMMYRKGTSINFKGVDLDSITVANFEEEQEAKRNGYNDPLLAVERIKEKERFFAPFKRSMEYMKSHLQFIVITILGIPAAIASVIAIIEHIQKP